MAGLARAAASTDRRAWSGSRNVWTIGPEPETRKTSPFIAKIAMTKRSEIIREALDWRGTPFVHGQRTKGAGCDCIGFVWGVGETTGALKVDPDKVKPFLGYNRRPGLGKLVKALNTFLVRIENKDANAGDVALYSFKGEPTHVGILLGNGDLIEQNNKTRKVDKASMSSRLTLFGFWRYPGLIE